ncbi:MAG: hypothetical protein NTV25_03705 [Methanothrix sp.]|nr:hypothetical protein [Methanothrix sp.]
MEASTVEAVASIPDHPAPHMLEENHILQGRLLSIEDGPEGLILVRTEGVCHACQRPEILERWGDGSLQEKLQGLVGEDVVIGHIQGGHWGAGKRTPMPEGGWRL